MASGPAAVLFEVRRSPLLRHARETARLAWPITLTRLGAMLMFFTDLVMVGHASADELAYFSISAAAVGALVVTMFGLLMGTMVMTATHYGAGEDALCGAVWRRSLAYGLALGLAGGGICLFGEEILLALGQNPALAAGGGRVMMATAFGIPAHLLFIASDYFLEGLERPIPPAVVMAGGNLVNILLDWMLVFGQWGAPEMGAEGAAWATAATRWLVALGLIAYVWTMPGQARFAVRRPARGGFRSWRLQRRIGYGSGASGGIESSAFSALSILAGWLGALALGSFTIGLNLVAVVFMFALGIGSATAVRVGNAVGRGAGHEMLVAGWTGLLLMSLLAALFAALFLAAPANVVAVYTSDPDLAPAVVSVIWIVSLVLILDCGQNVLANALRGRGDIWVPTACHIASYYVVMLPLGWFLAFPRGLGASGLFLGILVASAVSFGLLAMRFQWLGQRARRPAA